MSRANRFSRFLRDFIVKQHPYFSCCASCGEIKTPLGTRLCTSLTPKFRVDAVLLPDLNAPEQTATQNAILTTKSIRKHMPWIENIYSVTEQSTQNSLAEAGLLHLPLAPESENDDLSIPPEYRVFQCQALAEHYLQIYAGTVLNKSASILDFFTPNGLPLLPVNSEIANDQILSPEEAEILQNLGVNLKPGLKISFNGIQAQCKTNLELFMPIAAKLVKLQSPDRLEPALAHFCYAKALSVPTAHCLQ